MNSNPVQQIIGDAIEVIEAKGWTKNTLINSDEQVCTLGAIDVATQMGYLQDPNVDWKKHSATVKELVRLELNEQLEHDACGSGATIPNINDSAQTSQEDILLGLKYALIRSERPDPLAEDE